MGVSSNQQPGMMTAGAGPMAPAAQPNVYGQSAGAYSGALQGTQNAMAGPNIGQFANPFIGQVFN
ncbi:MAG: hypothetical protein WCZ72_13550, partial [Gemmobacter sp.]